MALLALATFGCDHATKLGASQTLAKDGPLSLLRGVLELRYTQNHDTGFGLLARAGIPRSPTLLVVVALLGTLVMLTLWWQQRARLSSWQHASFALVLAGALGNLIDRAVRGYVVDFIHLEHWPVFNIADIAVVVGMLVLLVTQRRVKPVPT